MAFTSLQEVCSGSFDWTVRVRVLHKWRGTATNGKELKGFNLLLLDFQVLMFQSFQSIVTEYILLT